MPVLLDRSNDALIVNPPAGNDALSVNGSDWLWAVTAIYAFSAISLFGLSFIARSGERIFHYIFIVALLVGSITYFAQASDLGFVLVRQVNSSPTLAFARQIFWPKYVNWVVSFPAIIIALGLLSGVSWALIVYNIFLSWIWVIGYLVSAFTTSNYKWGFFAFGTVSLLVLSYNTLNAHYSAQRLGVLNHHTILSTWANFLWLLYPIAYGLSDGGNRIGVTPGFIFFGVLDLLLVPVLSLGFLFLSRKWDYNQLDLAFTQSGRVHGAGHLPEHNNANANNGTNNTASAAPKNSTASEKNDSPLVPAKNEGETA